MDYRRIYPDPDMELIQRALLSDHRRELLRKRRRAIITDVLVVIGAPAALGLVLYAGEIARWLGVS